MSDSPKRKPITDRISTLDPVKDHQEIVFLLNCHTFYWDIERALEFALFRSYAVPSISQLLSKTREFKKRPRKRYDDTELIMSEILENGYDSNRARRAFSRMNSMHNRRNISNNDLLYVLTTFIYTPIYWIEQYGWRKMTEGEKIAWFLFFKEIGRRMNIKNIPEDYDSFEKFHHQYELDNFKFSNTSQEIGKYTSDLFLGFYLPKYLFFVGRPFIPCFMDNALIAAMGFHPPSKILRIMVKGLMRFRANILKLFPERKLPHLQTKIKRPSYPEGYKIEELGTFPNVNK